LNVLFHAQIATRFSITPVTISFICDLYHSDPFRLSNAFCQSMKQAHNSSFCQNFVVILLSASSRSSKFKLIFSTCFLRFFPIFLLIILATIFAVSVTKLNVRFSLHFVVFGSFYKTKSETLGHCLFHICCLSVLSLF